MEQNDYLEDLISKGKKTKKVAVKDEKRGTSSVDQSRRIIKSQEKKEKKFKTFNVKLTEKEFLELSSDASEYFHNLHEAPKVGPYASLVLQMYLDGRLVQRDD